MARGISLHIGLNHVDLSQYPGFEIPVLKGCINDANAMRNIAKATGFATTTVLVDAQATALAVKNKITEAAGQLMAGDIFFLSYSGHGSQIPDEQGDEEDGSDETWVLYDRQLIDDELYDLWKNFKQDVRIFVLSDSCHSGTMVKLIIKKFIQKPGRRGLRDFGTADIYPLVDLISQARLKKSASRAILPEQRRVKTIPENNSLQNYVMKKELYQNIQQLTRGSKNRSAEEIKASLLYISGCQDNQESGDGAVNGIFTGNLLSVWNNGNFTEGYKSFYENILALMPADQTPNYMSLGINIPPFEAQKPFTILASTGQTGIGGTTAPSDKPSITGPSTWNSNSLPPSFTINKGSNPYYYIEVATDCALFNNKDNGSRRSTENFYATWNDASTGYQLYDEPQYQLPQTVWDALKTTERLYYRAGTTIDQNWNGWVVTVDDEHNGDAPYISVVQKAENPSGDVPNAGDSSQGSDQPSEEVNTDQPAEPVEASDDSTKTILAYN